MVFPFPVCRIHVMDALVDDEEVVTATSEASTDKDTVSESGGVSTRKTVLSPVSSVSSLRTANGTVVFTSVSSPTTSGIKHHGTVSQAIAVPQPGGAVSIVQLQIPNQSNVVQSVIQPNQQSVIQAAGGATTVQTVQLISARSDESETVITTIEDESKKRREVLARRPSYRKILNELSSAEAVSTISSLPTEIKQEDHEQDRDNSTATITVASPYLKVVPASAIQLATGSQDGTLQGIQTLTMTNATGAGTSAIVQYTTQGQDGQFFVPVSAADLQAYQLRTSGSATPSGLAQGVVMTNAGNLGTQQHQIAEDAAKKRELRLLKNREAAKECRRKKKEYIKCLENRVAVLENQNKALIEELKSLKELYCQKNE